jgi:hypothetical protein
VRKVRRDQGIDGILIDPTPEGEEHLRRLCVRGRYEPVYGSEQLRDTLARHEEEHREKAALSARYGDDQRDVSALTTRLDGQLRQLRDSGSDPELLRDAERVKAAAHATIAQSEAFREELARPGADIDALRAAAGRLSHLQDDLKRTLDEIRTAVSTRHDEEMLALRAAIEQLGAETAALDEEGSASELKRTAAQIRRNAEGVMGEAGGLAHSNVDVELLLEQTRQLSALLSQTRNLQHEVSEELARFRVSLNYPKVICAGFSSKFLVQIYPSRRRQIAVARAERVFDGTESVQVTDDVLLQVRMKIVVKLSCPAMKFEEPVHLAVAREGVRTTFLGQPTEGAAPGRHDAVLNIRDAARDYEILSIPFSIDIVDYAFDHVSRPVLGRISGIAVGALSLGIIITALVTQTGEVITAAGGAAGGALSAFIFARLNSQYQRRSLGVEDVGIDPSHGRDNL